MTDLSLIARQLQRETEQGEHARQSLEKSTRTAQERAYASSTVYGQKLLKTHLSTVSANLRKRLVVLGRGNGAVDATTVFPHLKAADPEILAVLTMKVALDVIGKEQKPSVTQLCAAVGSAVEVELKLQWYQEQDKDLFKRVTKRFHASTGTRQKATVYQLQFNREGLQWESWGALARHKIGSWCLDGLITATGWITKECVRTSKHRTETVIRYSRDFLGLRDAIMEQAKRLAYCMWPMLCPPNDWTDNYPGGYLTETVREQNPMVRRAAFDQPPKQGDIPIDFLNTLQRIPYKINNPVLDVAAKLHKKFISVGKMIRLEHLDPPPAIPEDADEFTVKEYKLKRRIAEDHNAQLEQKNWRTSETLFVAKMYATEPQFWLPWSYDYRGRVYSQVTGLNPQGTDFDKSLIYFAKEGKVDEGWLAWHCATTYGHDKLSHEDRRQWTRDNLELITAVAEDPISNLSLWEGAGEPWCFLAAAIEYHACCIASTKQTSGLPIGIDATCSGLQHLSSMTLDRTAAKEVNVVRGDEDRPSDGYRTVAEAAIKHIKDKSVHPFIDRKTTKRTVMTVPYGVSRDSARDYIRQALREKGFDLSIRGRLGEIVNAIYRNAIREVFQGPVDVMEWMQESAMKILDRGEEVVQWTTPSGFVVMQDLRKSLTVRVQTKLMGAVTACWIGDGWGDPDRKHHKGAIAPNTVHSFDASLLHLTFHRWRRQFTVIHDCVLGRSCDMDSMAAAIRHNHASMYRSVPLRQWAAEIGVTIPDGLIKGDLDIDDVIDSPYYFC